QTNIRIEDYDDNVNPSYLTLTLSGNSNYKLEFLGGLISSFLVSHKKQEIVSLKKMSNKITVGFRKQINANVAKQSLINYFGDMEDISAEITKKLDFWKCIVNLYKQTNYNMVTIPRNYYQELLIGKEAPSYLTAPIEAIHKIPIRDIP
ncbi:MAG: hypothetical protein QSU88_04910, partial [Candidatus Methanoperedens sp.]|nr:hypothetical protein [Candidatus Methanoperedens sp.]